MNNFETVKSLSLYKECLEGILGGHKSLKMRLMTSFSVIQYYVFLISILLLLTFTPLLYGYYEVSLKMFIMSSIIITVVSLYIVPFQKKQIRYNNIIKKLLKHPTPLLFKLLDKINHML